MRDNIQQKRKDFKCILLDIKKNYQRRDIKLKDYFNKINVIFEVHINSKLFKKMSFAKQNWIPKHTNKCKLY